MKEFLTKRMKELSLELCQSLNGKQRQTAGAAAVTSWQLLGGTE